MRENILFVLIFTLLCIGLATTSDLWGYKPRGWRPDGPRFDFNNNQLHTYGAPGLQNYEPPNTALSTTTTPQPETTTSISIKTSTTPRNREPTTAPNEQTEDDFNTNPLAIANSFAFNRPVYIYNTFPFPLAQIITQ